MRIIVDIDGVLCKQVVEISNVEGMQAAKPIWENIRYVRKLKQLGHEIIIFTSRIGMEHDGKNPSEEEVTIEWLGDYGVPYDKLIMSKPWADFYIEDRAIELGELYEKLKI